MHLIERASMAFFGGIGYPTQAFAYATALASG